MKRILIINGPNLNLLGVREPDIYGTKSYADLLRFIEAFSEELGITCEVYQSNHEGDLVDRIQAARGQFCGIIINPAAYTHTSIAIPDAIKAVGLPTVEVHLSDVDHREPYRAISYTKEACIRTIAGLGFAGYRDAACLLLSFEN